MNKIIIVNYFFLAILAFIFPFYYGFRGIFPLDSFLIFNGGYNILNGFYPFKDYWTITGPLLDYIQYFIFLFFDINWKTYVLHASIINVLVTLISFFFFCKLGLNYKYSLLYCAGISVLGYSQTGTPFMDHHAFMFTFISSLYLLLAIKFEKKIYWHLSSVFLVFSFFSKQLPSALMLICLFFLFILYYIINHKNLKNILTFFLTGVFTVLIIFLLFYYLDIPIENVIVQYILYPMTIGVNRQENLNFDLNNTVFQFKFIYFSIIPLILAIKNIQNKISKDINELMFLLVLLCLLIVFLISQLLTKNQIIIFFIIPFFLGISHFYLSAFKNNRLTTILLLILLFVSVTKFHFRFNEKKKFMDLESADFNLALNGTLLDKTMAGIKWITPYYINEPDKEINLLIETKKIINEDQEEKIIMSDYQILQFLTKNNNVSPNKWYDDMSVPAKNNIYRSYYFSFLKNSIVSQKISHIYIIGKDVPHKIDEIFKDKNCAQYKNINELTMIANIKNCKN